MKELVLFVVIIGIIVLITNLDKKNNENINLKIELIKERIRQGAEYKKYKKMGFNAIYNLKETLLYECKKSKEIFDEFHKNAWKSESFLEKYALLELLNDLAMDKFDSKLNDDIYIFDIDLDDK